MAIDTGRLHRWWRKRSFVVYAFLGVAFIVLRQLPSSLEVTTPPTLERSSVLTHPHPQIVLDRATTCNNNDGNGIVAATSALRAWANNGTHARALGLGNFYGKTLTMGSLIRIHPCVTLYDGSTRVRDFVLIVMGSAKERLRLEIMQRLWSRSATDAGARIIYVSDAEDAALGTITLPGAREPSYAGAQNRSLKGLQYAVAQYPDARWYWMVDDDTYFHVEEAAALVRNVEWRVPLIVGHIFRGLLRFTSKIGSWPSGGSGMLLSHAAAHEVAAALFTPRCPSAGLNDKTLGHCSILLGIPLLHHQGFQPELEGYAALQMGRRSNFAGAGAAISNHMLKDGTLVEKMSRAVNSMKFVPPNTAYSWSTG